MKDAMCPSCSKKLPIKPLKEWEYGNWTVSRLRCSCGKVFNYYKDAKSGKIYTIPKNRKVSK